MIKRTLLTTDGVAIAYRRVGPTDGPVVVLCHGICASGRQFEADAGWFAAAGYSVLVPDLRAHGASSAPPVGTGDYTLRRLAADMLAVLDDAGAERVHWCGNSLGGIVGLGMLGEAPGRFASFATFGTVYRLGLPKGASRLLPPLYKALGPRRLGRVTAAMTTEDPAARRLIAEMIADFDPGPGERIAAEVRAYDLTDAARHFAGPVLVIRSARDRAVNLALGATFAAMADHPDFHRGLLAGKPSSGTDLRIVDDEIVVTGRHVNQSYLNGIGDADNKLSFDGRIWHRTGDAGRLDGDGFLWLRGRLSARAGAIYPFEAEIAARSWAGVRRAALVPEQVPPVLALEGKEPGPGVWLKAARRIGVAEVLAMRIPLDRRHRSKVDYVALRQQASSAK